MIRVIHHNERVYTPWEVYVGRPSPLGNPFSHIKTTVPTFRVLTREEAIINYREWLAERVAKGDFKVMQALSELVLVHAKYRQLDLVCWCHPRPCHANVIAKYLSERIIRP